MNDGSKRAPVCQVVADFRKCEPGTAVLLRNSEDFLNNEDYKFTDRVMKFIVKAPPDDLKFAGGQPAVLSHKWDGLNDSTDNPKAVGLYKSKSVGPAA